MKKGFTLIELLIVIVIIGILAVAFIPSIMGAPAKARDAGRISAVSNIVDKLAFKDLSTTGLPAIAGAQCINAGSAGTAYLVSTDFEAGFPNAKALTFAPCVAAGSAGGFVIMPAATNAARLYVSTPIEITPANGGGGNSNCPGLVATWTPTFYEPGNAAAVCFTSSLK